MCGTTVPALLLCETEGSEEVLAGSSTSIGSSSPSPVASSGAVRFSSLPARASTSLEMSSLLLAAVSLSTIWAATSAFLIFPFSHACLTSS